MSEVLKKFFSDRCVIGEGFTPMTEIHDAFDEWYAAAFGSIPESRNSRHRILTGGIAEDTCSRIKSSTIRVNGIRTRGLKGLKLLDMPTPEPLPVIETRQEPELVLSVRNRIEAARSQAEKLWKSRLGEERHLDLDLDLRSRFASIGVNPLVAIDSTKSCLFLMESIISFLCRVHPSDLIEGFLQALDESDFYKC